MNNAIAAPQGPFFSERRIGKSINSISIDRQAATQINVERLTVILTQISSRGWKSELDTFFLKFPCNLQIHPLTKFHIAPIVRRVIPVKYQNIQKIRMRDFAYRLIGKFPDIYAITARVLLFQAPVVWRLYLPFRCSG